MELPQPPAHIAPYVRVLGVDGAIEFLLAFGGGELYLSTRPQAGSRLSQMIGQDKAAALAAAIDAMTVRVPVAKPWIASVWRSRGLPVAEIARKLHVTDVTVRAYVARSGVTPPEKRDPRQLTLF